MKISIQLTAEVDVDSWMSEFGVDKSDVRDDVKSYILAMVQSLEMVDVTAK